VTAKTGRVVASFPVEDADQIMLVTNGGQLIRTRVEGIRIASRSTQGVIVFDTDENEKVVSVERISEEGDDNGVYATSRATISVHFRKSGNPGLLAATLRIVALGPRFRAKACTYLRACTRMRLAHRAVPQGRRAQSLYCAVSKASFPQLGRPARGRNGAIKRLRPTAPRAPLSARRTESVRVRQQNAALSLQAHALRFLDACDANQSRQRLSQVIDHPQRPLVWRLHAQDIPADRDRHGAEEAHRKRFGALL